jgi:hypothetical protein
MLKTIKEVRIRLEQVRDGYWASKKRLANALARDQLEQAGLYEEDIRLHEAEIKNLQDILAHFSTQESKYESI